MEAPKPQESINLTIEDEKKKYNLNITNSSNALVINISEEGDLFKKEYSKEFTLKDLSQNGRFFKIFDDIASVIVSLKETFENKKPKIKEENGYIEFKIIPILTAMGETTLIIPMKKSDDKETINNLCDIIKNQANDIKDLKSRVTVLEEKMKKLGENNIIRRIKNKDNLIGDIIKNEEQYNLICDYIDKDKEFKFQLLYKGTKDGDTYDIFHKKCDNQGPTISIIESTDGQIFGGYTSKSWDINNKSDISDPDSFLFNINIKKKYCVSNNKGLYKSDGYICDFGGSSFHELWLDSIYFSKSGWCDNGNGYNFKNYELSGGKRNYKVKECEVYKVIEN